MDTQAKPPKRITILIWIANIFIVLFGLGFILTIVITTQFPRLTDHNPNLEGATKYSFSASSNFFGTTYFYEHRLDDPEVGPTTSLLRIDTDRLFKFTPQDSAIVNLPVRIDSLSQSESRFAGLVQNSVTVHRNEDVLLRVGHPGTPITSDQMKSEIRSHSIIMALSMIYLGVVTWFLRGFISGLRNMSFFSADNLQKLNIAAWMLTVGPLLSGLYGLLFIPSADDVYRATAWQAGFSLDVQPVVMLFGLLLLAITWCFRYGVEIQKEQEYTI